VANKVGAESAVSKRPDLDKLIPTSRDNDGSTLGRRETNAGDPLRVTLVLNSELAITKSVPKLNGAVTRARHNLSVISAESNGKDILGVVHETTGAATSVDLPKTEGTVPGTRQSILTIRRDNHIRDKVVVASKRTTSKAIVAFLTGKGPDKDRFISGGRKDHGRILRGGGNSRHPTTVAGQNTSES